MYDSCYIWQGYENLKETDYLRRIPNSLSNPIYSINDSGAEFITGNLENLIVSISEKGLRIKGSLNKYWHKNNFKGMNRENTEQTFEKLQDILHIPLINANISRIDIAHNLIMNEEVYKYYYFLGKSKYYNRLEQSDSIYYKTGSKIKIFYNKLKEAKVNGVEIPTYWLDKKILRYELRLKSRLKKIFNRNQILVCDLYKEDFYIEIIDIWVKEYTAIQKNKLFTPDMTNMTNKDAKDYLLSALVEAVGHNEVLKITSQWKNHFSTAKEAQRFKKSLSELNGLTRESPLITELDNKILKVKELYL